QPAATFIARVSACVIDEHATHHLGRYAYEVLAVAPGHTILRGEAQVSFVHQSCRLKRVVHTFTPEIVSGQTSQFIVDADEEFIGRWQVTFSVGFGWFADLSFRGHIPLQLVEWSWTCLVRRVRF